MRRTSHFNGSPSPIWSPSQSFNPEVWETYLSRVDGFIPILIICYNNGWMVHRTLFDLYLKFGYLQFVIVDNGSSSEETILQLQEIESLDRVNVIRLQENYGPYVVYDHPLLAEYRKAPYLITDPDLDLSMLPDDAIEILFKVGSAYRTHKTGVALDISPINSSLIHDEGIEGTSYILKQERGYWKDRLSAIGFPPEYYQAPIDTTFCFIFPEHEGPHIRIAGSYTVIHLPWIKKYIDDLSPQEFDYFKNNDGRSTISKVVRRYRSA